MFAAYVLREARTSDGRASFKPIVPEAAEPFKPIQNMKREGIHAALKRSMQDYFTPRHPDINI